MNAISINNNDNAFVNILLQILELHDPYTKGHSSNVGMLTKKLYLSLYPDSLDAEEVYVAALLHDIGKIGINELILNKPTSLTEAEYIMIQSHTKIGIKIIEPLNLPSDSLLVQSILYHHENYDGSGYLGLKGDQIPLIARIIRVTDFYAALTERRVYREAFSKKKALAFLEEKKDLFDSNILSYYIKNNQ